MDKKARTVQTYDINADKMAADFNSIGARKEDIDEVFELLGQKEPSVLEIGCGNGRDAAYIITLTKQYIGMDISAGMIEIARRTVPSAKFEVGDAEIFEFPRGLDVIFAFASLLHVPKEALRNILKRAFDSLNSGGLFRISLKHSPEYREFKKEDDYGERTFYMYSEQDIADLAAEYEIVKMELKHMRDNDWLEVILRKA